MTILNIVGTLSSIFSIGRGSNKVEVRTNGGVLEGKNFSEVFSKILLGGNNLSDVSSKNTALNNILPTQTGKSGKVLYTDGDNTSWQGVDSLPNKTATLVRRNTNQAIAGNTLTKVQFNTTLKDSQTEWNSVNFRWISKKTQDIIVTASGEMLALSNTRKFEVFIYLNGTLLVGGSSGNLNTANQTLYVSVPHILSVNLNDYIEIYVRHSDGSSKNLPSAYLSIKEI